MARQLTAEEMSEAAIWAEGTRYTKEDIVREYRAHLRRAEDDGAEPSDIQRFCEMVLEISPEEDSDGNSA